MYDIQHSVFTKLPLHICYNKATQTFVIFPYNSAVEGWGLPTEGPVAKFEPKSEHTEKGLNLEADKPTTAEKTFISESKIKK